MLRPLPLRPLLAPVSRTVASGTQALPRVTGGFLRARWLFAGAAGCAAWVLQQRQSAICEPLCEVAASSSGLPGAVPVLGSPPGGKSREGFVRRMLGVLWGIHSWSLFVALWGTVVLLPLWLLAAVATQQWQLAAGFTALFALPHLVPIPSVPFARSMYFAGMKRWLGPPGTCRLLDLSQDGASEPEPEPSPGKQGASERDVAKKMYCYHPHGILSTGALLLMEAVPDLRVCGGPVLHHYAPLFRLGVEGLLGVKFGSASPSDLHGYMRKGESPLMLVPGGFHEATITCSGHERVYLKHRKGFIKYALRYGYDLVPVYSIGENDLMSNPQGGWSWRFALNNLGIPAVLPFGFPLFPIFPRRGVELVTAVGPTVKMPHIPKPTAEDVSEHHERYMREVQKLYDRVKKGTASEARKLEVW